MKFINKSNLKVAYIGNYLPKKCGIATFTNDLRTSVSNYIPHSMCKVFAMSEEKDDFEYGPEVIHTIAKDSPQDYIKKAEIINNSNFDVVSLQHEYGIYGGKDGSYIIELLKRLKVPVIPTFHTILDNPSPGQKMVLKEIASLSKRIVVMSPKGKKFLTEIYNVPENKIEIIPHGIPDTTDVTGENIIEKYNIHNKKIILTFGLLSPNKGIEYAVKAMGEVVKKNKDFVYIVAGATHPNLIKNGKDAYRDFLESLVKDLHLEDNIIFINEFLEIKDLLECLSAADIYITPYLHEAQITSGTLAFAYGCGNAVISTPYWHAAGLLKDDKGILVPFKNETAIADSVLDLLNNPEKTKAIQDAAYLDGRRMLWKNTGGKYAYQFYKAAGHIQNFSTKENSFELPQENLYHLMHLTDDTGIAQHSSKNLRDYNHGYCIDDNARALILVLDLIKKYHETDPELTQILTEKADIYAAFINYAYNPDNGHFRNFMDYSRQWLEQQGSDDSEARGIWALGKACRTPSSAAVADWAKDLIKKVYHNAEHYNFIRSNAFAIFGLTDYLSVYKDKKALKILKHCAHKLNKIYESNSSKEWMWFESELTYDNAVLPEALIRAGEILEKSEYITNGIESLGWLCRTTIQKGIFSPPGCKGFYKQGEDYPLFDQQPLEAYSTTSACIKAWEVTGDKFWLKRASTAFAWFTGANIIKTPVADLTTGGCHDGIMETGLNSNMGAESTLAYLISANSIETALKQGGYINTQKATAGTGSMLIRSSQ